MARWLARHCWSAGTKFEFSGLTGIVSTRRENLRSYTHRVHHTTPMHEAWKLLKSGDEAALVVILIFYFITIFADFCFKTETLPGMTNNLNSLSFPIRIKVESEKQFIRFDRFG